MPTDKKFPEPQPFTDKPRPQIALQPVESHQIGKIGYDEATQTLAVQFKRGAMAIYHYPGVTPEQWAAFNAAESKGAHFGQHFKALAFEKFPNEPAAEAAA